jgi:hypothetical protein
VYALVIGVSETWAVRMLADEHRTVKRMGGQLLRWLCGMGYHTQAGFPFHPRYVSAHNVGSQYGDRYGHTTLRIVWCPIPSESICSEFGAQLL